jgi:hypothetical protein
MCEIFLIAIQIPLSVMSPSRVLEFSTIRFGAHERFFLRSVYAMEEEFAFVPWGFFYKS